MHNTGPFRGCLCEIVITLFGKTEVYFQCMILCRLSIYEKIKYVVFMKSNHNENSVKNRAGEHETAIILS